MTTTAERRSLIEASKRLCEVAAMERCTVPVPPDPSDHYPDPDPFDPPPPGETGTELSGAALTAVMDRHFATMEEDLKAASAPAKFTILVAMYEKMGRFDCFWCPNQRPAQALKVIEHYPELAGEWMAAEDRKGHSFLSIPLRLLPAELKRKEDERSPLFACSCFGGNDDMFEDEAIS